jgi:NRPS condensation-like uncharacterized protein
MKISEEKKIIKNNATKCIVKNRRYGQEAYAKALKLKAKEWPLREIQRATGIPKSTLSDLFSRNLKELPRYGKEQTLNEETETQIIRFIEISSLLKIILN